jgi:hypothetical protein
MPLIIGGVWQSIWLFVFAATGTAVSDLNAHKGAGERKQWIYFSAYYTVAHTFE